MKYICLDTNIYIHCALLTQLDHNPVYLEKLLDLIQDENIILLVPEVVKAEYDYKVKQVHKNINGQLGQLRKHVMGNAKLIANQDKEAIISFIDDLSAKRKKAKDDSDDVFKRIISSGNCLEIPLAPEILTRSLLRTLSHRKPYDPNKYPDHLNYLGDVDCIIIESLKYFFSDSKDATELHLCCNDGHFYNKEILHQDIKDDFSIDLYAYKTLPELLTALDKPQRDEDVQAYKEVSLFLSDQIYASFSPIVQVAKQISKISRELQPFNDLARTLARDMKMFSEFTQNVPRVNWHFPQIDDEEEENKSEQQGD